MKWKIYFITAIIITLVISIINESTWLLSISSITGVVYTLLVAKNIKWGLLFGIVNVATYGYICIEETLYGGVLYNIGYSLPMLIWGTLNWFRLAKKDNSGVKHFDKKQRITMVIMALLSIVFYAGILTLIQSENIILDSITSVLGYLGIYLLTNKYIEQWYVFTIVNATNLILWIILTVENTLNLPMTIMWLFYLINSIYGIISWNKKYKIKHPTI